MGRLAQDLTGQVFGRLSVLSRVAVESTSVRWKCACVCGRETTVYGQNLRNGSVQSCGCGEHPVKHGASDSRLYQTWASMHARCNSKNYHARAHYHDRGIGVCESWAEFDAFAYWAEANGYADDLTLDRIDNDRGYEPGNCRFITIAEQQRNKSNHRMLTHAGETLALYQWGERLGVSPAVICNRLSRGWSVERALTTPKRSKS